MIRHKWSSRDYEKIKFMSIDGHVDHRLRVPDFVLNLSLIDNVSIGLNKKWLYWMKCTSRVEFADPCFKNFHAVSNTNNVYHQSDVSSIIFDENLKNSVKYA